jgi:hypothetical protein
MLPKKVVQTMQTMHGSHGHCCIFFGCIYSIVEVPRPNLIRRTLRENMYAKLCQWQENKAQNCRNVGLPTNEGGFPRVEQIQETSFLVVSSCVDFFFFSSIARSCANTCQVL